MIHFIDHIALIMYLTLNQDDKLHRKDYIVSINQCDCPLLKVIFDSANFLHGCTLQSTGHSNKSLKGQF